MQVYPMPKYSFSLSPCGADLELEHNLLFPDTWSDTANSNKLITHSGNVDSTDPLKLICHSGPPDNTPIITLPERAGHQMWATAAMVRAIFVKIHPALKPGP
jgi:hypothetical protein